MSTPAVAGFETTDLGQAALVMVRGFALLSIEPAEGRRMRFVFPTEAAEAAAAYYRGAAVPARAYFNAVRDLKALLCQR